MMDMVPQAQIDTYRARCVVSKNQSKFVYYLTYSYCMFKMYAVWNSQLSTLWETENLKNVAEFTSSA